MNNGYILVFPNLNRFPFPVESLTLDIFLAAKCLTQHLRERQE